MEFLFQRILKDAGKVDICRFGGIVEPAGNGKGFSLRVCTAFRTLPYDEADRTANLKFAIGKS